MKKTWLVVLLGFLIIATRYAQGDKSVYIKGTVKEEESSRNSEHLDELLQEELDELNEEMDELVKAKPKKRKYETEFETVDTIDPIKKSDMEIDENKAAEDWNYQQIRDLMSQLNTGIYWYADKLTKNVVKGKLFQKKFFECKDKFERIVTDYKANAHDKIRLQEQMEDLRNKYNALKQVLEKVKDLNDDNRQTIDKLRANRDRCLQAEADKSKTIESLRNQASELRRKITHFRGRN